MYLSTFTYIDRCSRLTIYGEGINALSSEFKAWKRVKFEPKT